MHRIPELKSGSTVNTKKKEVNVKLEHYDEMLLEYSTTTTKLLRPSTKLHNDGWKIVCVIDSFKTTIQLKWTIQGWWHETLKDGKNMDKYLRVFLNLLFLKKRKIWIYETRSH